MKPLVKKLKHLQSIAPNSEWKAQNKVALLAEIAANPIERKVPESSFVERQADFIKSALSSLLPTQKTLQLLKPAGALFSLSLLVLSSGIFTVSASQATLPGDTLYSIKIATERVQRALTTTDEEKAKLDIAFAGKRINELEQIVSDSNAPDKEKNEKVAVVLIKFQENIDSAQEALFVLNDSLDVSKTVALAQVIDNGVTSYKDTLKEVAQGASSDELKGAVQEAASRADAKGDAALAVIVEKHHEDASTSSFDEVAAKVDNRLQELEGLINEVDSTIASLLAATSTDIVALQEKEDGSSTTTKDLLIEQQAVIADARESVEDAKKLISEQKFIGSLALMKETKDTVKGVREFVTFLAIKLSNSYEVILLEQPPVETTSSTDAIISEDEEQDSVGSAGSSEEGIEKKTDNITSQDSSNESTV